MGGSGQDGKTQTATQEEESRAGSLGDHQSRAGEGQC